VYPETTHGLTLLLVFFKNKNMRGNVKAFKVDEFA
jgi:hypothetical protein